MSEIGILAAVVADALPGMLEMTRATGEPAQRGASDVGPSARARTPMERRQSSGIRLVNCLSSSPVDVSIGRRMSPCPSWLDVMVDLESSSAWQKDEPAWIEHVETDDFKSEFQPPEVAAPDEEVAAPDEEVAAPDEYAISPRVINFFGKLLVGLWGRYAYTKALALGTPALLPDYVKLWFGGKFPSFGDLADKPIFGAWHKSEGVLEVLVAQYCALDEEVTHGIPNEELQWLHEKARKHMAKELRDAICLHHGNKYSPTTPWEDFCEHMGPLFGVGWREDVKSALRLASQKLFGDLPDFQPSKTHQRNLRRHGGKPRPAHRNRSKRSRQNPLTLLPPGLVRAGSCGPRFRVSCAGWPLLPVDEMSVPVPRRCLSASPPEDLARGWLSDA